MMAIPPLAPVSQIGDNAVSLTDPEKSYAELALRQGDEPDRSCKWLPKPEVVESERKPLVVRFVDAPDSFASTVHPKTDRTWK